MNRLYRFFKFKVSLLAFLTLVMFAVYVLAGRLAMTRLPDYRQALEQYLSEKTNTPIIIESLKGSWIGFDPIIVVSGVQLNGAEHAYVGSIRIHFAILKSLLSLSLRIKSITLNHSVLMLRQGNEGSWQIAGIDSETLLGGSSPESDESVKLASLFDGTHFTLNDNQIAVYNRKNNLRNWRFPVVSLDYKDDKVYASGRVLPSEGATPLLSFSYEGYGVLSGESVRGMLYLEARSSTYLDELLRAYEWQDISLQDIDASARMWVTLSGASISEIQGDFQISELNWRSRQKSLPPVMNIAADFHWMNRAEHKRIDMHWNGFSWAGRRCEPASVRVDNQAAEIQVWIETLDIQCISRMAVAMNGLPVDLQRRLEVSDPSGYLANIQLVIPADASSEVQDQGFTFQAELNNVSLGAYSGSPGVKGIDGHLLADAAGGSVIFDSQRFELAFPDLFLSPWKMKRTEGAVSWRIEGDDVAVYSEGLRLRMPDDSLVYGDFSLWLNPAEKEDYLSLALALQDIQFEDITRYVPFYLVDESVYRWLNDSMLSGSIVNGIYYGNGSIEGDDSVNSFTSSLRAETLGGRLTFAPEWPDLENLNAHVILQNGALNVQAETATIHDTPLIDLVADMPESEGDSAAILNVEAKLRADESVLAYWLTESPIAENTAVIAEQMRIKGELDVNLAIDVPMDAVRPVAYEITSKLQGIEIEHPDSSLLFKDVTGKLLVSSRAGVSANNVQTILLGQPASLSIATVANNVSSESSGQNWEDSDILFSLTGKTSIADLLDNYQLQPIPGLEGTFDYYSELRLPADENEEPMFTLSSDMVGVSRHWPAPLNKESEHFSPFKLALMIKPDQLYVNASIDSSGESAQAPGIESELLFVGGDFSYGEVRIGNVSAEAQTIKGLNIRAAVAELELEPWIDFAQRWTDSPGKDDDSPLLEKLELEVQQLHAFGQEFEDTHAYFSREPSRWAIELQSNDIKGRVMLPLLKEQPASETDQTAASASEPIRVDLEHLYLASADIEENQASTVEVDAPLVDPRALPLLAFSSRNLFLDGQHYGAWRTLIAPSEQGALFKDIEGSLGGANLRGQLNWQRLSEQQYNSILTLDVTGGNVEQFVKSMGWPQAISSDHYQAEIALVWPDEPSAFELAIVSGSIAIQMNDGALKTADEKTGALRLFGILNADAIFKRLTLDFSDLYESGISYDELSARATINQGQLQLAEPLLIDGPSSSYTVNGTADLTKKTLDMDMLVELPFSQNVPLAALVLGAPQIGGVVWLVDKILGEPLSAITTARYDITGSWDDPKVEMQQAINAVKKDRTKKEGLR